MKKYLFGLGIAGTLVVGLTGYMQKVAKDLSPGVIPEKPIPLSPLLPQNPDFSKSVKADTEFGQHIMQNIASLPLTFHKNMGQWTEEILYCAPTPAAKVAFRKNGLSFLSLREVGEEHEEDEKNNEDDEHTEEEEMYERLVWNLNFKGTNSHVQIVAEGEIPGVTHYLIGNDSSKWIRNTPQCKLINYKEIYDHIDLHYYGLPNGKLEYDFIVKQGGNINSIQMALEGAGNLTINHKGQLIISTPWGKVAEEKPFSYQTINGIKKEIDIRYRILNDSTFGFKAYGNYDKNHPLVIDPKQLVWTTFVKGTNAVQYVQDIAIDANKNSYITGWTDGGLEIKPVGTVQGTFRGSLDAFVCKFNRWGTQLIYCTYLGGSGEDSGFGIAASPDGNAYVTGRVESDNFPVSNAVYPTTQGGMDIFISALNPAGTGFVYSTYFGCGGEDKGLGVFVNASNEAYVTGYARAPSGFPTTAGAVRTAAMAVGNYDAFVVKMNTGGTVAFCTLVGGSGADYGNGIFVSTTGEIYVTGETNGGTVTNFITAGSFDITHNGNLDGFLTKLNANGTAIGYSTFLGGSANDVGYSVYVRNNEAYVTGSTVSTNFPTTPGAYRTANAGGTDVFALKLNAAGSALIYSTYLGGSADESAIDTDKGSDIVVNDYGQAYVSGITISPDFPVSGGYDVNYDSGDDGFMVLLADDGKTVLCSSFMGGEANDYKRLAMSVDVSGGQDTLYSTITTHSRSTLEASSPGRFPVLQAQGNVYGPTHINGSDDEPAVWKMVGCRVVPLPVELVDFKGIRQAESNLLQWSTTSEINNDYFSVERSYDGINFNAIAIVDGAGNSESLLQYSYSDSKVNEDITYYRIRQTDFDGKTSYSNVIAINAPQTGKPLELFISCPVTDQLIYSVCCLQKGQAHVEIIDLNGKTILKTNVLSNAGFNKFVMDAKNLTEGLYILKFSGRNGAVSGKFVK